MDIFIFLPIFIPENQKSRLTFREFSFPIFPHPIKFPVRLAKVMKRNYGTLYFSSYFYP